MFKETECNIPFPNDTITHLLTTTKFEQQPFFYLKKLCVQLTFHFIHTFQFLKTEVHGVARKLTGASVQLPLNRCTSASVLQNQILLLCTTW